MDEDPFAMFRPCGRRRGGALGGGRGVRVRAISQDARDDVLVAVVELFVDSQFFPHGVQALDDLLRLDIARAFPAVVVGDIVALEDLVAECFKALLELGHEHVRPGPVVEEVVEQVTGAFGAEVGVFVVGFGVEAHGDDGDGFLVGVPALGGELLENVEGVAADR